MKKIMDKNGLAKNKEKFEAEAIIPGPCTPSLDTIWSLMASQKATRGAYFFFNSVPVSVTVSNTIPTRASLLGNELRRRGLKAKRLLFKSEAETHTAPVGFLVFAIDQQAARRLCCSFEPDDAFWCDRLRPAVSLKPEPFC